MYGTDVGHFPETSFYECLEKGPDDIVDNFYKADEELKRALVNGEPKELIKSMHTLLSVIGVISKEMSQGAGHALCKEFFDTSKSNWKDFDRIE